MSAGTLFRQIGEIVRLENQFYVRHPRLIAAALAVSLIPAVYVMIFLSSVWDPPSHTDALPVALVNLDRDARYREQSFNLGSEVIDKLRAKKTFRYLGVDDPGAARQMVADGRAAFAVVIPADFSANALPGTAPGAGRLEVIASEGNSYQAALLARRFAAELGHEINDQLSQRRWQLVLTTAAGSEQSVDRLREAVERLRGGGGELAGGATQVARGAKELDKRIGELNTGIGRLTGGARELGSGLRTLDARQPAAEDLDRLKAGSDELARGHVELGKGLGELKSGSARLRTGLTGFRDEAQSGLFVSQAVVDGANEMADGMIRLDDGLRTAADAQRRLTDGSTRLHEGTAKLVDGVKAQGSAVRRMATALPADAQIEALGEGAEKVRGGSTALADGAGRLQEGSAALSSGLTLLAQSLPRAVPGVEGSAAGLSRSVDTQVTVLAPVPNNGSAAAPNIIPAALWLGAGIAAFLVHVRVLPRQAAMLPRFAQLAGKLAMPAGMVLLQAITVVLALILLLKLEVASLGAVTLAVAVSALAFLAIVFALTRAFGDAGKALAILFLAVQLSSSGGMLPVELSGGVFAEISPWMPLTWVVKALKAAMFGAYDFGWGWPLLAVATGGLAAFGAAGFVGSWRYVEQESMRPPVEL